MPDLQGLAYFPGIEQLIGASYTLAHGITPGVIQVEMTPQPDFAPGIGSFFFYYGDVVIELPNCRVEAASFDASTGGFVWRLAILDRRWMWASGQICGNYNQSYGDGSLRSETIKTPQDLARLCLEAMGEQGYDVNQMPNGPRPTIDWDFAVPAQALADLADELGCRIVLGLDDTVAILPSGDGEPMPDTADLQADSLACSASDVPDSLVVVGAPVRYQADLPLMAVGWNTDGTILPLASLDYAPNPLAADGGFGQVDLNYFNQITDPKLRVKAMESVFRWYQVDPSRLTAIPGYGPISDVRQILPLGTKQLDTAVEPSLGEPLECNMAAQVFGVWYDTTRSTEDSNTVDILVPLGDGSSDQDKRMLYYRSFSLEPAAGLVKFDEPVYRKVSFSPAGGSSGSGFSYGAAQLMLRTTLEIRDAQSWSLGRYQRQRDQDSPAGSLPRYLWQDIQLTHIARYGSDYSAAPLVENNQQACDQLADAYLDAAEVEYVAAIPQTCIYAGLKPVNPDGAIQQVTWSVALRGATTQVCRNVDRTPYTVPYAERRATAGLATDRHATFHADNRAKRLGGGMF
ncbi:MAG TPA: hypothetical protein VIK18_06140 [Pirellulales bacterium]